jgi:hypothetical protein
MNSEHSYERLLWNADIIYKPFVKFHEEAEVNNIEEEKKSCDSMKVIPDSEIIIEGHSSNLSTMPAKSIRQLTRKEEREKESNIPLTRCHTIVLLYHKLMTDWYNYYSLKYKKEARFTTLTVPPEQKTTLHNKKVIYGSMKIKEQIKYLRNKITEFFIKLKIEEYMIIYELTRNGQIHAHFVFFDIEEYPESYKDLAFIMGYETYKKIKINIVEKECTGSSICYYLCKLLMGEEN